MKIVRAILPPDFIPGDRLTAEKAGKRVADLVIKHLRKKNDSTKPSPFGMPKSNYYAKAADTVQYETAGNKFTVSVGTDSTDKNAKGMGIALHYHGGTVYPKKKALALPIDPAVAGIWPSEAGSIATGGADDERYALIWPKGSKHGFIKDTETNDLLWLLLPKATIPADPTVLPTDEGIANAATLGMAQLMGVTE